MHLKGCIPAMPTPWHQGHIDESAWHRHLTALKQAGVQTVVVAGTTGEGSFLTKEQSRWLIQSAKAQGLTVIAGTGHASTRMALENSRAALHAGADALLVVTPYYVKPTQEGLLAHYLALAEQLQAPILLYDVASRTGTKLDVTTVAALSHHPHIIGIKDASDDPERFKALQEACTEDFILLSGDDASWVQRRAQGVQGVITVAGNVLAPLYEEMAKTDDLAWASSVQEKLAPLYQALFVEGNPVGIKGWMHLLGWCQPDVELPLMRASEACLKSLRTVQEAMVDWLDMEQSMIRKSHD